MPEKPFAGSLKPGAKLGKYEVREQLATGGMAIIYRAYDPSLDRYVAIKQIAPHLAQDERFLERFRTEAQTLAKLSSSQANIVNVHELIQQEGQLYLVMECVEGTTLRVLMDRGPVPLQTSLGVLLSTALGLKAMHSRGIVHRDLSPSNIMMAKDGALKITDFGLIGHSGGKTSLPMGTTKYMAPEMFTGVPVDARADLYSLGMIAYEMLVGPEKFAEAFRDVLRDERAQQVRWMHWHSNPALKPPALRDLQPGVPPLVAKIVERMMEKDPSRRFASSEQIIKWLRRIFVMHVQGKSISVTDSESLEKEIEADAAGVASPAVRPAGSPKAGQAGEVARPGAGPPAESGEKTAALPVAKWTWKRAVFWAAVIGGPLILAAAGLIIWNHYETAELEGEARAMLAEAHDLWNRSEWTLAAQKFTDISRTERFRKLKSMMVTAKQYEMMARAEDALEKKEWKKADTNANIAAQDFGVSPTWVTDFKHRFNKEQDKDQVMKEVELAAKAGSYEQAITLLTDLQAKYAELDLNDLIAEYREKRDMGEYNRLVDEGKEHFKRTNLDAALVAFEAAKKIRPGSEVDGLLKMVEVEKDYIKLLKLAQKAAADGKWADARTFYAEIMKLKPSEAVRTAMNNAAAEELAAQARTLEKNGLLKEAIEIWTKVIGLNPNHGDALAALKRAGRQQQLDSYMKAGKTAMGQAEWDQAVNSYQEALKLLDPSETDLKTKIEAQINEARYQKAMALAADALKQKSFGEAERLATEARGYKDSSEVNALIERINTSRQYYTHLDLGKELLRQINYVKALESFQRAQKVMDTEEVRDLIVEANYRRYLGQGKSYLKDMQLDQARSVLMIAQRAKDTIEVQAVLQQVELLIADRDKKKKD